MRPPAWSGSVGWDRVRGGSALTARPQPDIRPLPTRDDAAGLLNVSESTLRRLVKSCAITQIRVRERAAASIRATSTITLPHGTSDRR